MVHLVVVHGRSHEFAIPSLTQRPLEEAIRFGLKRVLPPDYTAVPVSLAFYGDHWRPDAGELESALEGAVPAGAESPTTTQQEIAADLFGAAGDAPAAESAAAGAELEALGWGSLNALATRLDQHLRLGDVIVRFLLEDVESYFADAGLRGLALDRVEDAVRAAADEVILLGHSLGSVVTYDLLRQRPGLPVRGMITLGSPLGLPTVRRRLGEPRFPDGIRRWVNVFDPRDFVTGRETLRTHYLSTDGRAVEDLESEGMPPGLTDLTAAHDGQVYLSSVALALALREMIAETEHGGGGRAGVPR